MQRNSISSLLKVIEWEDTTPRTRGAVEQTPLVRRCKVNCGGASLRTDGVISTRYYTQVITLGVVTPWSHFFADKAWAAVAVHAGGGPATAVAVTVTSFEGLKP